MYAGLTRRPSVLGIDVVTDEPEPLVKPHRARVALVDVQDDLALPGAGQVREPGREQRRAEAHALRGRRDAEHVHLADAVAVHLRPVETEERAAPLGEQEAGGIE